MGDGPFVQRTLAHLRLAHRTNRETAGRRALARGPDHLRRRRRVTLREASPCTLLKRTTSLTNGELGRLFGGVGPSAIAQAARRVEARLGGDDGVGLVTSQGLTPVTPPV